MKLEQSNEGVFCVSIVDSPAIESSFMLFTKQDPVIYTFKDDQEHILTGAVMIPDKRIYRKDPSGFEYEVFFSKDTVKKIAERFMKNKINDAISLDHSEKVMPGDAYIFESYIVDSNKGLKPNFLQDIPDGTWVASVKIDNPELWTLIKDTDLYHGFSVEVLASPLRQPEHQSERHSDQQMKSQTTLKNMTNKFTEFLKSLVTKFGDVQTDKGQLYWEGEYDLKAGDTVYIADEAGEYNPAPEGEYITPDNKTIIVGPEGVVSEIKDPDAEVEAAVEASEQEPEKTKEDMAVPPVDPVSDPVADPEDSAGDLSAEMETLKTELETLKAAYDDLKAQVDELLKSPQAESAFSAVNDTPEKKDKNTVLKTRLSYLKRDKQA